MCPLSRAKALFRNNVRLFARPQERSPIDHRSRHPFGGNDLLVSGERALDQLRRQHDVGDLEENRISGWWDDDLDGTRLSLGDAAQLGQ